MRMTMNFWTNFSSMTFFLWLMLTSKYVLAELVDECHHSTTNAIIHSSKANLATYAESEGNNDGYFSWIVSQLSHYDNSIFIASTSNPCEGVGFHWKINSTDESIRIAAAFHINQTTPGELIDGGGWAGVGFSETGGMRGADVVYFNSLTSKLVDAHIRDSLSKPMADKQQDWKLLDHTITEDGYLIFEAARYLNTEDDYDRPFVDDSPTYIEDHRLIAAWGKSNIKYHGNSVVRTSIQLFDSLETDASPGLDYDGFLNEMDRRSFGKVDLLLKPYKIPVVETTYHDECFSHDFALNAGLFSDSSNQFTGTSTIIGYEFLIDPGSVKYLHHIIFYGHVPEDGCNIRDKSKAPIFVWTPGEEFTYFPQSVGVKFGGQNGFKSFSMTYHFDNKDLDSDKMDTGSGIRLFLSNERIRKELGMMQIGDPLVGLKGREVGDGITSHSFLCPSTCSQKFRRQKITIVRQSFHMHSYGKRIVNEFIRNNTVVRENSIDYWDFDQTGTPAPQQRPFKVLRGDEFRTTCYFDTKPGTVFGTASSDEMCMVFMLYFPKQEMSTCRVGRGNQNQNCLSDYLGSKKFENLTMIGRKFANLELSEDEITDGEGRVFPGNETSNETGEEVEQEIKVSEAAQMCTGEYTEVALGSSIKLRYKLNDTTFTVEMKTSKKAWLALGINQDGLMLDSDAVIGSLFEGVAKYRLENTKSRSGVNKVEDERQTLLHESFVQNEEGTTMTFTKLLEDGNDMAVSVKGETTFIYALGYDNRLGRGHSESGSIRLSFCSTVNGSVSSSLRQASKFSRIVVLHIFFAVLPFGLMMPIAIAASRLRKCFVCKTETKRDKALWFIIHIFLNSSSFLCVLISVILAAVGKHKKKSPHFERTHEIIGMVVLILLTIQMVGGIMRPKVSKKSYTEADSEEEVIIHEDVGEDTIYESSSGDTINVNPISHRDKWRLYHKIGGVTVLVLGIFNCILGIFRYQEIKNRHP